MTLLTFVLVVFIFLVGFLAGFIWVMLDDNGDLPKDGMK